MLQLTLRQRMLLFIGSGVVIIAIVVLVLWLQSRTPSTPSTVAPDGTILLTPPENVEFRRPDVVSTQPEDPALSPDEMRAKQSTRIFVERFLSYSNQNNNQHVDDALVLSTESMRAWVLSQSVERGTLYEGMTTEILSTDLTEYTVNSAVVAFQARQVTSVADPDGSGRTSESTTMISGRVDLVKSGQIWLVNGLWIDS